MMSAMEWQFARGWAPEWCKILVVAAELSPLVSFLLAVLMFLLFLWCFSATIDSQTDGMTPDGCHRTVKEEPRAVRGVPY